MHLYFSGLCDFADCESVSSFVVGFDFEEGFGCDGADFSDGFGDCDAVVVVD
jgi:hypothetical protein